MQKRDDNNVRQEFKARQNRQIVAIAVAMFLMLLAAVLYKRPDLLGPLSGHSLFGLQAVSLSAFLGFTAFNWRCPSCGKHLGGNIHRQRCEKCGTWLQ